MTVKELVNQFAEYCTGCKIGYKCNGKEIFSFEIEDYYEKELTDYLISPQSDWYILIYLYFD
jgi:hypothetical protein